MRTLTAMLLLCCCVAGRNAAAANEVSVESLRREDALEVVCSALVNAPLELIWRTLTDYARLAEFVPGMRRSRVLSREGAVTVVEQAGEASFLFVTYPIEVTLASTERSPYVIEASLLKGNLKRLEGAYRIEPQVGGRMLLTWVGVIEALSMPPLIGELLMRSTIGEQFRGMVREVERRDQLRRARER